MFGAADKLRTFVTCTACIEHAESIRGFLVYKANNNMKWNFIRLLKRSIELHVNWVRSALELCNSGLLLHHINVCHAAAVMPDI